MIPLDSPRMRCNASSWRTCTAPTSSMNSSRRVITPLADERNANRWSRAWVAPARSSAKSSDDIVDLATRRLIHRGKHHPIDRCVGGVGLLASLVIFATRSEYLDYTPYLLCCSYHSLVSDLFRWSLFRCWSGWFGFGVQISDLRLWWSSSLVSIRGGSSLLRPATYFLLFSFFPIWELYTVFLSHCLVCCLCSQTSCLGRPDDCIN